MGRCNVAYWRVRSLDEPAMQVCPLATKGWLVRMTQIHRRRNHRLKDQEQIHMPALVRESQPEKRRHPTTVRLRQRYGREKEESCVCLTSGRSEERDYGGHESWRLKCVNKMELDRSRVALYAPSTGPYPSEAMKSHIRTQSFLTS